MTQESFLEDVNNLLNSGEVPNMLTKEDIEIINSGLATEAREKKVTDVYAYFVQKVRSNFHVVLAMSPVGGQLRVRLRMFPSLVNCCTIEWLQKWPEEALLNVASIFLDGLEFDGLTGDMRSNLYKMCVYVHQTVEEMCPIFYNALRRNVYVTPKSYLDVIETYKELLV
jgi:dynein heavy chain